MGKNPVEVFVENHITKGGYSTLAKLSATSYQMVHKTMLGLYKNIPTRIVQYMAEVISEETRTNHDYISPAEAERQLQRDYQEWCDQGIKDLIEDIRCGRIEAEALFVPANKLQEHYPTFKAWRESMSYSQIDFCKTFYLHQAIINKYESGGMVSLPASLVHRVEQLLEALFEYPKAERKGELEAGDSVRAYLYALKKLPLTEPPTKKAS
jgi:transcriptional regulator with XRE-family HTH domain